ncbi:MAG: N-acetylmuramoyl-L-alanine amidase [Nitrospirota bacterium]|nr:N-acetylmuramoyl-L-alanine amidase [Nitrospirota bacterium]
MRPGIHPSPMVVMKYFLLVFQIFACLLLLFQTPADAAKSSVSRQYSRAVSSMKSFMDKESKKKYRSNWEKQIDPFLVIAKKYPKSSIADDALFQAGEGYLNLYQYSRVKKDLDRASDLFEKIVVKYPKSDSADEALFKLGEVAFSYQQDLSSALSRFERLTKKYPKSKYLKEARKMAGKIAVQLEQEGAAKKVAEPAKETRPTRPSVDSEPAPRETAISAVPTPEPPSISGLAYIKDLRHWSNDTYTRVVIDLDNQVTFDKNRLYNPDRLYFDLHNCRLDGNLEKEPHQINDGILKSARVGQFTNDTVRLVLDLDTFQSYQIFPMENPSRLVIDVVAKGGSMPMEEAPPPPSANTTKTKKPSWALRNWQKAPTSPSATPSLARQLGLGVHRIVIDAGHGGNDPGAVGPTGLREKDVVLDIAVRLAKLVKAEITDDVILTRKDDTFIPLEERTAIANKQKADLFISVHANASRNKRTKGIETYLLNLTADKDAIEVAARENQASMKSMSDLGGVLKEIMKTAKKDESLHLAHHVQKNLVEDLSAKQGGIQNLGVKEAPFWVLIGAQMPSILTEVGFISNEDEEERLGNPEYRQEIAQAIFNGVKRYVSSVSPKVAEASSSEEAEEEASPSNE